MSGNCSISRSYCGHRLGENVGRVVPLGLFLGVEGSRDACSRYPAISTPSPPPASSPASNSCTMPARSRGRKTPVHRLPFLRVVMADQKHVAGESTRGRCHRPPPLCAVLCGQG
ncbi:hypothetical protein C2845_PM13G09000 [Panicum miliaceum]|uniref:Uncharacterized protein n=1 Tax=Panicum miliaceum TaxID=4540 RepID=A0A3L6RGN1_PANMI|nr:hypothetical protein C2845_PM13G09000 [Panicum miliaceum]